MRNEFSEYQKVEEVANKFVEGVKYGKPELLKSIFHPDSIVFGHLGDELQKGSAQGLFDVVEKVGKCGADYVARIDILALEDDVAVVRVIEDNWDVYKFTDFLTLLKIDGEWKIVAKAYNECSGKK